MHQRCGWQADRRRAASGEHFGNALAHMRKIGMDRIAGGVRRHIKVVLAPHHAARAASGTAGIDQDLVIARTPPWGLYPRSVRQCRGLKRHGPFGARPGAIIDMQPQPDLVAAQPHCLDGFCECAMKDHRHRVCVVPQVVQFALLVAVVGVDRHQRRLHAAKGALQVFRAVVQVQRHLVLACAPCLQEGSGEAIGTRIEFAPGGFALAMHLGDGNRHGVRHRFPDICEIPL